MSYEPINASDARNEASRYGTIPFPGNARKDGGWDFVVDTDDGEIVVSVVRADDGSICSEAG